VREIGGEFDIKSSSVFDLLTALEKKGRLKRGKLGARSLIVEGVDPRDCGDCAEVPLVGTIAAGRPIEAIEDPSETLTVDRSLLRGGSAFALKVEGDSMVDAGILDGDCVVVRKQDTADNGDIVVAVIECDATLKRFYREKNRIRLQPANRKMKPIYVASGEFMIQGKVVAVQRTL
jgi:repressor LexA